MHGEWTTQMIVPLLSPCLIGGGGAAEAAPGLAAAPSTTSATVNVRGNPTSCCTTPGR
jgi:hypothetical protein